MYLRQCDPLLNEDKSNLTKFVASHIFDGNVPLKQFEPENNTRSAGNENTDADMVPEEIITRHIQERQTSLH